ncbi:murein transglycosylase [Micromonospora craterilacus]|uniref:Murein transglycosylase n=1 Tax=Micromonospora craterilacus TaxID=1655439 RepID=A0A2W2FMF4_9ACTN|nr:lytic transglycosylase domain-containing protein [Micromonospora craterilacus]PZG16274.1 murein transglycosylase [Micromonospora craterilacus]
MADGEERTTLRPLRPATPHPGAAPDGPATGLPRPRRPWLRSARPADGSSGTAPAADTTGEPATRTDGEPPAKTDSGPAAKADSEPAAKATDEPNTKTDGEPAAKGESAAKTDGEPATKIDGEPAAKTGPDTPPVQSTPDDAGRPGARRRRTRFAHAVRLPGPRTAARVTRDWSRRPSGRLTLPGVFLLALVAATATAGALLVPAVADRRPVAADATAGGPEAPGDTPPTGDLPPSGEAPPPGAVPPATPTLPPGATPPTAPGGGLPVGGRPSDALAGWAREVGAKAGIDPIAMQAYGYAELVLAETNRSCGLSWTTLAAIGFVESRHGQANNAQLGPDGRATPEIIGLPLDGQGGRMRINDTDRGELDGDTTYDRAVGPMQFIPTTWQENGADADNDGRKDPHNIHDAALAAGMYLCKGGRNLTIPGDWWNAILSYNNVGRYARAVFDTANRYGQASRT